jgi:hypothetical protein
MERLISLVSRVLVIIAFALASIALWEKVANLFGLTVTRGYAPWRLLEFTIVVLLFVIALQLREIKTSIRNIGTS